MNLFMKILTAAFEPDGRSQKVKISHLLFDARLTRSFVAPSLEFLESKAMGGHFASLSA